MQVQELHASGFTSIQEMLDLSGLLRGSHSLSKGLAQSTVWSLSLSAAAEQDPKSGQGTMVKHGEDSSLSPGCVTYYKNASSVSGSALLNFSVSLLQNEKRIL